jgi:hypothetical protein
MRHQVSLARAIAELKGVQSRILQGFLSPVDREVAARLLPAIAAPAPRKTTKVSFAGQTERRERGASDPHFHPVEVRFPRSRLKDVTVDVPVSLRREN